jgi:hypothetical protein
VCLCLASKRALFGLVRDSARGELISASGRLQWWLRGSWLGSPTSSRQWMLALDFALSSLFGAECDPFFNTSRSLPGLVLVLSLSLPLLSLLSRPDLTSPSFPGLAILHPSHPHSVCRPCAAYYHCLLFSRFITSRISIWHRILRSDAATRAFITLSNRDRLTTPDGGLAHRAEGEETQHRRSRFTRSIFDTSSIRFGLRRAS